MERVEGRTRDAEVEEVEEEEEAIEDLSKEANGSGGAMAGGRVIVEGSKEEGEEVEREKRSSRTKVCCRGHRKGRTRISNGCVEEIASCRGENADLRQRGTHPLSCVASTRKTRLGLGARQVFMTVLASHPSRRRKCRQSVKATRPHPPTTRPHSFPLLARFSLLSVSTTLPTHSPTSLSTLLHPFSPSSSSTQCPTPGSFTISRPGTNFFARASATGAEVGSSSGAR